MEHFDIVGLKGKIHGRAQNDNGILELSVSIPSPDRTNYILSLILDQDTSDCLLAARKEAPESFDKTMSLVCILLEGFTTQTVLGALMTLMGDGTKMPTVVRALSIAEGKP